MRTVLLSGAAAVGLLLTTTPASASDSSPVSSKVAPSEAMQLAAQGRKGSSRVIKAGQHRIGFHPRPGFHGIPKHDVYRRPHRGFVVPRYWIQPAFLISNYSVYGLSAPSNGYNWSRYYDDVVLMDNRGFVQDYKSDVSWNEGPDRTGDFREPEYSPAMRTDSQVYNWNDDVVFAAPDGSSYSYDGEWDGKYIDPQGRVFEGDWTGRVTRRDELSEPEFPGSAVHTDSPHPQPDYDDADMYEVPRGYENFERCLKNNGLKGAAIGALLGGVLGNRAAGRGNRTAGSLVGAGIGGILGAAAEKASNKCRNHHPHYSRGPAYYPQHRQRWSSGYYYYPQAPVVTVTVVPGTTTTTTTVTEEIFYQTVRAKPRKKIVRKWKPKPRCVCR